MPGYLSARTSLCSMVSSRRRHCAAAGVGFDQERRQGQWGGAAAELGEQRFAGGHALEQQTPGGDADPDVDDGDGERVGQLLEVVGHRLCVAATHVEEVDVVDFTDRRESNMASDLR